MPRNIHIWSVQSYLIILMQVLDSTRRLHSVTPLCSSRRLDLRLFLKLCLPLTWLLIFASVGSFNLLLVLFVRESPRRFSCWLSFSVWQMFLIRIDEAAPFFFHFTFLFSTHLEVTFRLERIFRSQKIECVLILVSKLWHCWMSLCNLRKLLCTLIFIIVASYRFLQLFKFNNGVSCLKSILEYILMFLQLWMPISQIQLVLLPKIISIQ